MDDAKIKRLAAQTGDVEVDRNGRAEYQFDLHGLRAFVSAAIRAAVGEPVAWISCADRFPDDDADVIVWIGNTGRGGHHPAVDFFRDGEWMEHGYVTHWMPAPPAPDAQPKPAEPPPAAPEREGLRFPHDSEGTPCA